MPSLKKNIVTPMRQLLWIMPFASFLLGYYLFALICKVDTFETPALVGKNLHEVFITLSHHNLNPRLVTIKEDGDLPAGTVIQQTPLAGTKIKSHQSVFLVITKKPNAIITPNYIHRTASAIMQEATQNHLRIKSYYLDAPYPKDMCIAQSPPPGTPLDDRKIIIYLASATPKPVIVPNFKHMPVNDVVEFLNSYGITTTITHNPGCLDTHTCTHECIITDQRPLAGSLVTLQGAKQLHMQLQVRQKTEQ